MTRRRLVAAAALLVLALAVPGFAAARRPKSKAACPPLKAGPTAAAPVIEPKAQELLQKMSDFLTSQNCFSLRAESTREVVYPSGLIVDADRGANLCVQRPDHLKADIVSGANHVQIFYDGRNFTLYTPAQNLYGQVEAPTTLDAAIRAAEERYGLSFPGADFLLDRSYPALIANVQQGVYVGEAMVDGIRTDQLAFREKDMDWQVWIQQGDQPLPIRLAITDRAVTGAPRTMVTLTNWNLCPQFAADTFTFTPPEGAKRIAVADMSRLRAAAR